jgi:hypothetical protein
MREITIEPESMEAALAWLDSADKEKRDAKLLKAKMADQSDYSVIQALQSLIAYARVHPYGKVARIMRKRKLMERIGLTCWVEEPEAIDPLTRTGMKQITLTLSSRFHEWCRENPDAAMAKGTPKDAKNITLLMANDGYESLLDRQRKEGGSLAEWLISSDDFITDIEILDQ